MRCLCRVPPKCEFIGAIFYIENLLTIMEYFKEKVIIMGKVWDKENLKRFKKALVEGICRRLERDK